MMRQRIRILLSLIRFVAFVVGVATTTLVGAATKYKFSYARRSSLPWLSTKDRSRLGIILKGAS